MFITQAVVGVGVVDASNGNLPADLTHLISQSLLRSSGITCMLEGGHLFFTLSEYNQ